MKNIRGLGGWGLEALAIRTRILAVLVVVTLREYSCEIFRVTVKLMVPFGEPFLALLSIRHSIAGEPKRETPVLTTTHIGA